MNLSKQEAMDLFVSPAKAKIMRALVSLSDEQFQDFFEGKNMDHCESDVIKGLAKNLNAKQRQSNFVNLWYNDDGDKWHLISSTSGKKLRTLLEFGADPTCDEMLWERNTDDLKLLLDAGAQLNPTEERYVNGRWFYDYFDCVGINDKSVNLVGKEELLVYMTHIGEYRQRVLVERYEKLAECGIADRISFEDIKNIVPEVVARRNRYNYNRLSEKEAMVSLIHTVASVKKLENKLDTEFVTKAFNYLSSIARYLGDNKEQIGLFAATIPNYKDANGNTPLHHLCGCCGGYGYESYLNVQETIKAGADIYAKNNEGLTPIDLVMEYCDDNDKKTLNDMRALSNMYKLKEKVKNRKNISTKNISGAVVADKIAEGIISKEINEVVTPEVGKKLESNIKKKILQSRQETR